MRLVYVVIAFAFVWLSIVVLADRSGALTSAITACGAVGPPVVIEQRFSLGDLAYFVVTCPDGSDRVVN